MTESHQQIINYSVCYLSLFRWWSLVQKCVELEDFRESIGIELFRAQELLAIKHSEKTSPKLSDQEFLQKWESTGRQEWFTKSKPEVIGKIRDLVDLQVEVLHSEKNLYNAEVFIKDRPDILINRIVGHIQYLFDIKKIDGVLPYLNQVYIFNEEMKNFMSAIKNALGREKTATNASITTEVLHHLTKLKLRN